MNQLNASQLDTKAFQPSISEIAHVISLPGSQSATGNPDASGFLHYYPSDMSLFFDDTQDRSSKLVNPPSPPQLFDKVHPSKVVLVISEACNLRCEYCYVDDHGRLDASVMSDRDICRAIDLCGGQPMAFAFFGGEPLTAWDRIVWAVERAHAKALYCKQQKPSFHVTTNGTLIDREKAQFLASEGFSVLVSLDGPKDIHDHHRRTISGGSTYEQVIEGLGILKAAGVKSVSLRATFTPGCIELARRLEHLNDLCDQGYAGGAAVEPAVGCSSSPCKADASGYTEEMIWQTFADGSAWCIKRAREGKVVRWGMLTKAVDRILDRKPAFTECGAAKGYAAVRPNGEIHTCHKCVAEMGKIETGIEESLAAPWIENRLTAYEKCRSCWARFICGGPCRAEAIEESGKIGVPTVGCMIGQARAKAALMVIGELRNEPEALNRLRFSRAKKSGASDGGLPCA